jgi:nitrite reductase/ring-hydroxylating ferredoxin subunit
MPGRHLAHIGDLPDRTALGVDPAGDGEDTLFLVRDGADVHAWHDRCPHLGTKLPWRRHAYLNRAGDRIVCHAHGAEFELASGRCTIGPCLGSSLERVDIEITERGEIRLAHSPQGPAGP